MERTEDQFDALPQQVRDRAMRLGATIARHVQERRDPALVRGMIDALNGLTVTFDSYPQQDLARQFSATIRGLPLTEFEGVQPLDLDAEQRAMFIGCRGGINESTRQKLTNFFND